MWWSDRFYFHFQSCGFGRYLSFIAELRVSVWFSIHVFSSILCCTGSDWSLMLEHFISRVSYVCTLWFSYTQKRLVCDLYTRVYCDRHQMILMRKHKKWIYWYSEGKVASDSDPASSPIYKTELINWDMTKILSSNDAVIPGLKKSTIEARWKFPQQFRGRLSVGLYLSNVCINTPVNNFQRQPWSSTLRRFDYTVDLHRCSPFFHIPRWLVGYRSTVVHSAPCPSDQGA